MASPGPDNGAGPSRNFPLDPSEFDSDPRISFSKLDNKFILETEDGQEFVYDSAIKRWVQSVCLASPCFAPGNCGRSKLRHDSEGRKSSMRSCEY